MSTPRDAIVALSTKPDFAACMDRVEAWFHGAVLDRPPVRFYRHNAKYDRGEPLDSSRWPSLEARWFDTAWQIERFERSMTNRAWRAETFPIFCPNLGPNVYSAFYAGRLVFGEVTSWYEPILQDLQELSLLQNDPFQNVYFRKLEELTRAALQACGDRYWVGYPDLHPSLDCAAAWRGVDSLFLEMASAPATLAPLMELAVRDFQKIFERFDSMLRERGQPSVTWINLPCRGRFHVPSCDVSTMISTEHFKQFSLPQLRRELLGMDRVVYHVDGRGVARHLEVILSQPDIHGIQWVQGLGPDWPILQWAPMLKRILAAGKSIMVDVPAEELNDFISEMPPEGVFMCLGVDECEEQAILKRVEKW